MKYQFTFTVFTPTYNRANALQNVYKSLLKQTYRQFEWIIVDDGSTDNTGNIVQQWNNNAFFPIRYYFQPNGGKHRAFNRAVQEAEGMFFLTFDSDDTCTPTALERFLFHWNRIPDSDKDKFSAVTALCMTESGDIVGTRFPSDTFDSDTVEAHGTYKIKGDKWGFQKTEVLKRFPFPEIDGENFITERIVWNRIATEFKTRYVNEALQIHEYRGDGLSSQSIATRAKNPIGSTLYYKEYLTLATNFSDRVKTAINYLRFSMHAKRLSESIVGAPCNKALLALIFPFSISLFLRDQWKLTNGT